MLWIIVSLFAWAAVAIAVGRFLGEGAAITVFTVLAICTAVWGSLRKRKRTAIDDTILARSDMLAKPVKTKHGESGAGPAVRYGLSCMQGWRRSMEDAHTAVVDLSTVRNARGTERAGSADHALFGVFDGHRGSAVATFCGSNLAQFLVSSAAYGTGQLKEALVEAYIGMDQHLKAAHPGEMSGCTAVSLLVTRTELLCANAGDSRCVLCREGRAVPLSLDHKPQLPSELRRIQRAGSFVFRGRVQGVLALSRAIGDFSFKQRMGIPWEEQAVTCVPDVQCVTLDPRRDEFAVLACDGIWDVMSSQDVVNFVRAALGRGAGLQEVCDQLMDACLSPRPLGLGCDNMSVVIVDFKGRQSATATK